MWTNLSRLQRRVRNRRLGRKHYGLFCNLNLSAFSQSMLGCVLTLLVVYMTFAPSSHHGLVVDRYISHTATPMLGALREDAMKVVVTRDGSIYFGNTKIAGEDLAGQIRLRLQSGAQRKVYLVVDQRAQFGDLAIALDEVRHAGIWDFAFLAEFPVMHR
jgi:biopolymer transport protein ExbD